MLQTEMITDSFLPDAQRHGHVALLLSFFISQSAFLFSWSSDTFTLFHNAAAKLCGAWKIFVLSKTDAFCRIFLFVISVYLSLAEKP